jgi:hypothetical protein
LVIRWSEPRRCCGSIKIQREAALDGNDGGFACARE